MAGDNGTARELEQRFLQAFHGLGVEVVGGLVKKQQVSALRKRKGEVQTVSFAAGEHVGGLLLIGALEAECGNVGAARNLGFANHHVVKAAGNDFPDILVAVKAGAHLIDVGDLRGFADFQRARGGLLKANDHLKQGRLANAVRANDADDAVARQIEGQVVNENAVAESFVQVFGGDDF